MKTTSTSHGRGFTLIELLVVIAIISLLVAILVPTLREARALARRSVCAANMHHASLAVHVYACENDEWLPCRDMIATSNVGIAGTPYWRRYDWYHNSVYGMDPYWDQAAWNPRGWGVLIPEYIAWGSARGMLFCPGRPEKAFFSPQGVPGWHEFVGNRGSGATYLHLQYGRVDEHVRWEQDTPGRHSRWPVEPQDILAYEPTGYRIEHVDGDYEVHGIYVDKPIDGLGPMKARHGPGYNVLLFDNSIRWAEDPDNWMELNLHGWTGNNWQTHLPHLAARLDVHLSAP